MRGGEHERPDVVTESVCVKCGKPLAHSVGCPARNPALEGHGGPFRSVDYVPLSALHKAEARLEAERARVKELEEALERLANGDVPGSGDWGHCMEEFARAALATDREEST